MTRSLRVALVGGALLWIGLPVAVEAQSSDEEAVVAVAEALFRGMRTKDAALLEDTMIPQAFLMAMAGAGPQMSTRDQFVQSITGMQAEIVERLWSPDVRVQGDLAQLWAPYDLYVDGELSHCGIDAFHMVRIDGAWKMAGVTYTRAQPPACELHPEGPPQS